MSAVCDWEKKIEKHKKKEKKITKEPKKRKKILKSLFKQNIKCRICTKHMSA